MLPVSGFQSLLLILSLFFGSFTGTQSLESTPVSATGVQAPCPNVGQSKVSNELRVKWSDLNIYIGNLPQDSCYLPAGDTAPSSPYNMTVYPNIGTDTFSDPYDFGINISVEFLQTGDTIPHTCVSPVGYDDLRDETFDLGEYRVKLHHTLHYHYSNGSPNPYTPDITDVLLKVMKSIKLGKCS